MSSLRLRITEKIPMKLRILPFPAIRIISILVLLNILIWIGAGIILHYNPFLTTPALLSYTLGLRHALDADHISAIDLMTRRLVASGDKPVTVGTWFSLGHSTIVTITCIVVAATAGALQARFGGFKEVGGIIGTSVSAAVLLILGFGNAWILYRLVRKLQQVLKEEVSEDGREGIEKGLGLDGAGFLVKVFKKVFQFIDRPWKMYPLGVLFGLGFDTSSEVAVLGIASVQGASGTSIWLILIFPVLFTAGMCLLDTTDGALMMTLYTSTSLARDIIAILYYSIVLSGVTVLVALCIGVIQLLSLINNVASPQGAFWEGVDSIGDHYDIVGGAICAAFVVIGGVSVVCYKPWRRWVDQKYGRNGNEGLEVEFKGDEAKDGKDDTTVQVKMEEV